MIQFLGEGQEVIKHGRSGKPKRKVIHVARARLFWQAAKGSVSSVVKADDKRASYVKLVNVVTVMLGKTTRVFMRPTAQEVPDDFCFSVVTKDRTLDLVASDVESRDKWVDGIMFAVRCVMCLHFLKDTMGGS
jgi:hypothetical protein